MEEDKAKKMAVIKAKLKKIDAEAYTEKEIERYASHLLNLPLEDLQNKDPHDIEADIGRGLDKAYALK